MLKPPFYVVSDTHFFHKNIIGYCDRPDNHNEVMVARWNKAVGPNDIVLHLGDLVYTSNNEKRDIFFEEIGPSLNGKKYLILGNHDRTSFVKRYRAAGFTVIKPFTMQYRGHAVTFDHYPAKDIEKGDKVIRVHGHIHNSGYQNVHVKRKQMKRYGNVNVSVEVIDYTPQKVERVLDKIIDEQKPRQHYYNVNRVGAKAR